jgi:hypothetical protein
MLNATHIDFELITRKLINESYGLADIGLSWYGYPRT